MSTAPSSPAATPAEPPARPGLVGHVLANHRLITELGSGGMGTVYYAEHTVIGRRAAIKVLHPDIAQDEHVVARFLTEARAANEIRHPNVVEITDIGRQGNLHYIVMSFLEGETLEERLLRVKTLDEAAAMRITRQVASALGAAHERGIVHRDLKPENIFITNHPDFPDYVKVLDFGVAKLMSKGASTGSGKTAEGTILGTPTYMSPEQCRGSSALDARSDIYSLGVVMYRMLTGQVPFTGETPMDVMFHHAGTAPKPPVELNRKLAPHLNQVILRALQKEPAARFASMKELLQAAEPCAPVESGEKESEQAPETPETRGAKPVSNKLSEIIQSRIAADRLVLPAVPAIAVECMRVIKDPRQSFKSIGQVIAKDPLLSSRILKLANSAAFPGLVPAVTLETAIGRMGIEGLGVALVQFSLNQSFSSRDDRIRAAFRAIWEHSLGVALIAKDLATTLGLGAEASAVYLGGLLHDVGKPVVASMLLEAERELTRGGKAPWMGEAVWRKIVADSHRQVGVVLARKWNLPPDVGRVIEDCRSYDQANPRSCANVVRLANALTKRAGMYTGAVNEQEVTRTVDSGTHLLGLKDEQVAQCARDLFNRVATMLDGSGNRKTSRA